MQYPRDFVPILGEPLPVGYGTWEEWIEDALLWYYHDDLTTMLINGRDTSVTGCALSPAFTTRLELQHWINIKTLGVDGVFLLTLKYKHRYRMPEIAALWGREKTDVYELRRQTLQTLIRKISDNPRYVHV